jgi:hypothetical protein
MKFAAVTAFAIVLGSLALVAQATLPERVKRSTGDTGLLITRQISSADLPSLAKAAELIVRVVVNSESSRLSENQLRIETDYAVSVLAVYRGSQSAGGGSIVVTKPGGTLMIEGKTITASEANFPPFRVGQELLLFLSRHRDGNRYDVVYGSQGAFSWADGFVEQVYGELKEGRGRIAEASFESELRAVLPR